jgi:hypothetical protein
MHRSSLCFVALLGLGAAIPLSTARAADSSASYREEINAGLEEIKVFRTTRTARTHGATSFCTDAGFESAAEDNYSLWSLKLDENNSRIEATHVREVGEFRACFGAQAIGKPFSMFAAGTIGGIPWKGNGDCTPMTAQPPVQTVRTFNCNLVISGLPEGYVGGWLTSSTEAPIFGASAAPDAHVRGYLSTSVVVLRLWKKPTADAQAPIG